MRVKLDENLGERGERMLRESDCDVATVSGQGLSSSSDATLIEACRAEGRVLVSLDKGFSSPLRFPPKRYAGIVVLRLPEPLQPEVIDDALRRFVEAAAGSSLQGRLWIVDPRRVRQYDDPSSP